MFCYQITPQHLATRKKKEEANNHHTRLQIQISTENERIHLSILLNASQQWGLMSDLYNSGDYQ